MWWRQRPSPMHYGFSIKGQSNGNLLYFFSSWKGLGCCLYICIDEHEGDEAFGLVRALSFSHLILPLFLFVMLFAMVTALHSGQKKERKKRKNKTLHIIRNAWEKTNGNLTARISRTCMLPSISYYFFDTLFGFVLLQNLSQDESKAEASHYYTSIYPVCWLEL